MPDRNKAKIEQDANRVVSWLADNRAEFEERGINEDSLAGADARTNVARGSR